ncbi:two-component system response regulator BaeR [Chitinivorax tropicus]|uniref:Two-component system response regulator BaeR n=1 Tax=Chitinivorax tropicus TaxID=714531 RepID=A0A840MLJ2_9PROT|nr:response regulator [Chitinivorax tropicus]MBB5017757.1 two-component system response regulator BaeR [Chitinivorax tropicus]
MAKVLIVEDEVRLAGLMADFLREAGFEPTCLHDGAAVLSWVKAHQPDAILLDVMLPNVDGMTLCRTIRQSSDVPILMTTARVDEIDRLLGLELGADDYICKPYSLREATARVKAVLRRRMPGQPSPSPVQFADDRLQATLHGEALDLTVIEYKLLQLLAQTPGRIFSRDALMDRIYPDQRVVADRTIDSHVKKLRRKLAERWPDHDYIESVYGAGYRFNLPALKA